MGTDNEHTSAEGATELSPALQRWEGEVWNWESRRDGTAFVGDIETHPGKTSRDGRRAISSKQILRLVNEHR